MPNREAIREMIAASGLVILRSTVCTLPDWVVPTIYPDIEADRWGFVQEIMSSAPCEIGVVEGEGAIRTLFELCGTSIDPARCAVGTIRARFGVKGRLGVGDRWYYHNVIHRPRDGAELERELDIERRLR